MPKHGDSKRVFEMYNRSVVHLFDEMEVEKFYLSMEQAINKKTIDAEKGLRIVKSFERNQYVKQVADQLGVSIEVARELIR